MPARQGSNSLSKGGPMRHKSILSMGVFLLGALVFVAESTFLTGENALAEDRDGQHWKAGDDADEVLEQGKQIFRFDTFGDQAWWGDTLHLHQAIAGAANGGVGPGVSPKTALAVGLKVDVDALPGSVQSAIANGQVNLDDPAVTLTLLKLNSVVGVKGFFDRNG